MGRKKSDGREAIVVQLLDVFFEYGFDGTTLTLLEERVGLRRASIYHHFPGGKVEMARAVLEYADRWGEQHVCSLVEDESKPAVERLNQMLDNLDSVHYRPEQLSPANAFVIGEGRSQFGRRVLENFNGLVRLMTELMVACGIPKNVALKRAWEHRVIWEGGLVCARVIGNMDIFRALMARMPAYMLSPPDTPGILPEMLLPSLEAALHTPDGCEEAKPDASAV